jgi:ribosome maturation factor RimP
MKTVTEKIVKIVRKEMVKRGWTLWDVSLATKLNPGHVSRIMSGHRTGISINTAEKLFRGLNLKFSELDKETES